MRIVSICGSLHVKYLDQHLFDTTWIKNDVYNLGYIALCKLHNCLCHSHWVIT